MKIRFFALSACLAACADTGGRGDDDDGDGPLPANHIRGTIELDTRTQALVAPVPPDPSEVHVGLAWMGERVGADPMVRPWALQEVSIVSRSNSWPMEFELAITEPPPAGAIGWELGYSQAKFVAYRDNGNGTLDWTPVAADTFIDSVVAFHPHLNLIHQDDGGLQLYMPGEGEPSPPDTPITLLERSDERSSCHLLEATPRFAFEALRHSFPDPDEGDQGPWDGQQFVYCPTDIPPPGANLACQDAQVGQYQYYTSWPATGPSAHMSQTCGGLMHFCEGHREDPNAPGPWPGPCDPNVYNCVQYQLEI